MKLPLRDQTRVGPRMHALDGTRVAIIVVTTCCYHHNRQFRSNMTSCVHTGLSL